MAYVMPLTHHLKELNNMSNNKVLSVNNLTISFRTDRGFVRAVRGVSFDLYKGETLCIVGESGSGKSVTSKAIMGILSANAIIDDGSIIYEGEDLTRVSEEEFHRIRGKKIGMIFQDPLSSLNPIMKVGKQITEAMLINKSHLKRLYSDLIAKELIAYKNEISECEVENEEIRNIAEGKISKLKSEIAELKEKRTASTDEAVLKDTIATKKAEIKKILANEKLDISDNKFSHKIHIQEYKRLLDAKKVIAKKETHAYKLKLYKEYLERRAVLKEKLSEVMSEEEKDKLEKAIVKNREEYISSIRVTKREAKEAALNVMKEVGIPEPERRFKQYPFEFSGGMRQRIVIAIALTANPDILICDEPTTALDVTIQAQILELINKLKRERELSCIFITHDLGVVANMADRVAVMYAGKIVEYGNVNEIFYDPRHPYTWALLSSIPDIDSKERLEAIPGTPPNMIYPPVGDAFALRSKYALGIDFKEEPKMFEITPTHFAATWLLDSRAPIAEMPKIVSTRIKNSLKKAGVTYEQISK
ncbi:MAG: ATP-binding cassette domain-containing protein [Bacilli bacterium]